MTPSVTTTIAAVDPVFLFIFGVALVMLVGITAVMVVFLIKYNRRRHPQPTSTVSSNIPLEIAWTVIPTLLVLAMFYYGWAGYLALRNVPEGAMEVSVTGRMWSWTFTYANGRTSDRLFVPAGQPVRVAIHSEDVLHSFYIPAFRVKRDAVPGMTGYVWFVAPKPGSYDIFCAEYCGVGHSSMITTVEALSRHDFEDWLNREPPGEKGAGEEILARYGCLGCHSLDGTTKVGPSLQGIYGRTVTVLAGGTERTLTADGDYLRRAILNPAAEVVKGFPAVMPSYAGQISDHEIEELIEYFQGAGAPAIDGAALAREKGCLGCHSTDGSRRVGPSFKGLFGRRAAVVRDGRREEVTADAAYLRESILTPQAALAEGYPPVMPAYGDLSDEDLQALVDFIEGLH